MSSGGKTNKDIEYLSFRRILKGYNILKNLSNIFISFAPEHIMCGHKFTTNLIFSCTGMSELAMLLVSCLYLNRLTHSLVNRVIINNLSQHSGLFIVKQIVYTLNGTDILYSYTLV